MIRDKLRARLILALAAVVAYLERKARDLQPELTYVGLHHADEGPSTSESSVEAAERARLAVVLGEDTREFNRLIAIEFQAEGAT